MGCATHATWLINLLLVRPTCRSVMGVGEGVTYPSIQNLVRRWVPEDSRSRALSFIYSGEAPRWRQGGDDGASGTQAPHSLGNFATLSQHAWVPCWELAAACSLQLLDPQHCIRSTYQQLLVLPLTPPPASSPLCLPPAGHQLGTIASYLLAPYLISHYGWESVFWVFGSLGLPWALAWMLTVRNSPADQPPLLSKVEPAPKAVAAVAAEEPLRLQDVPWGKFFTNPAFLATVAAQVCVGAVFALFGCSCMQLQWVWVGLRPRPVAEGQEGRTWAKPAWDEALQGSVM